MLLDFYRLDAVSYHYTYQNQRLPILKDVSFSLQPGEMVALMGPSGSGKSTLLHIAGLLDNPTTGDVVVEGQKVQALGDRERTGLRNRYLGFVYQFHHLLPDFSALENVAIPRLLAGEGHAKAHMKARTLLQAVGLEHRASHRPGELSGGEQQRVALARALVNDPCLLLADEPTGNLDVKTGETVFALLRTLSLEKNLAVLMATHNPDLAGQMDRTLRLQEGSLHPLCLD